MKRVIKNNLIGFILGILVCGVTVYAATQYQAKDIAYKNTTVDKALDDLYTKANNQKVCRLIQGTKETVSAKYECYLGDWQIRNFYVLKVTTDEVELIMERNITDTIGDHTTMNWTDAKAFFDENHPGYQLKQTWLTKVKEVKLPDITTIAVAGGITGFDVTTATEWTLFGKAYYNQSDTSARGNYKWLWDYTRECSGSGCSNNLSSSYAYGYWTTDSIENSNSSNVWAWTVDSAGRIRIFSEVGAADYGVRPVITVLKSQLN